MGMSLEEMKVWALAKHLDDSYGNAEYLLNKEDYLVLEDDEADEYVRDRIRESVWAFNANFLESHTGIDAEIFKMLQDKCESSNAAILRMIKDFEHFCEDAISCDGRGHFMNSYDGEEHEVKYRNKYFYIYRMN